MTTMSPLSYGATRMLLHYATALKTAGHEVTVAYEIAPPKSADADESILPDLESQNIQTVHVPRLSWAVMPIVGNGLTDVARSQACDMIVSCQLRDAAGAMSVARRCGIPGLVLAQGAAIFRGSAPVRFFKKFLYRRALRVDAEKVICVAPGVRNRIVQYLRVPVEKATVILNGLDLDSIPEQNPQHRLDVRAEFGLKDNQFIFLNIGRFDPVKGLDILASAVHKLVSAADKPPEFTIMIAAEAYSQLTAGYRDQIYEMIERLGVQSYFRFIGFRKDCNRLLQAADCFVLPSRTEGLPLVVLEAFAARCPVILSEYGERFSKFQNNADGVYVPVGDATALAAAMTQILRQTPEQRTQMGLNGRGYLERHLTLDEGKREFVGVVNRILQDNHLPNVSGNARVSLNARASQNESAL